MKTFLASRRGRRVPGSGPLGAKLVVLAEAAGKDEELAGAPLVGPSGRFLFEGRDYQGPAWEGLDAMGVRRGDVRLENVMEVRPPENSLFQVAPGNVAKWQAECWRRLEKLTGATVIVPMGNLALNTLRRRPLPLTKKGKWRVRSTPMGPQIDWQDKISNWRGSIFNVTFANGAKLKCIPAFHPAYVLRNGDAFDVWKGDLERVVGDSEFPELRRDPRCEHMITPTHQDKEDFFGALQDAYARNPRACLAVDIETSKAPGRQRVRCVGFALDEDFSLTLGPNDWFFIAKYLRHPIAKVGHYFAFDAFTLARAAGVQVANVHWDTQLMHHCLDPRDEHRLAYCASRDLRVAFWKDERKEGGQGGEVKDWRKLFKYCGKDVCYTRALLGRYFEQLANANLLRVYAAHYRRLMATCLRLSLRGFQVDEPARKEIAAREKGILATTRQQMTATVGTDLIAKKGFSNPKVTGYFYDTLKCKPFRKRGSGTRTADELAIRRLMCRYKKARVVGQLILDYRQHQKIAEAAEPSLVDDDGRMRSLYTPTAKTGRLRSSKTPLGTGINAQNRDRHSDLRRMFVADHGQVLIEVDESQAEDRIVNGMSGDKELLRLARTSPFDIDQHILNACKVLGDDYDTLLAAYKAGDPVADAKRQTGKRTKYAIAYGMGGPHMAEVALVETEGKLVLDADECDEWLVAYARSTPGLKKYHEWVEEQLIEKGWLENSWGRRIYFKGLRLGKEDKKEGYAWYPQSEVGVLMNQWGFLFLDKCLEQGAYPGAHIVQQGHDSLVVSTPPAHAFDIAAALVENLSTPRTYPGRGGVWELSMPIGVKVGRSFRLSHEWKSLPSRKEFDHVTHAILRDSGTSWPASGKTSGRRAGRSRS